MNIFVLDADPWRAAEYQCDRHVIKMTLETAQILSTVLMMKGASEVAIGLYKATHRHHPCTQWAMASRANYDWLLDHGFGLAGEYRQRFGRRGQEFHKSERVIDRCAEVYGDFFEPLGHRTPFVQAMPDVYRLPNDPVMAYRMYYHHEKAAFATWKNGKKPEWWRF